MITRSMDSMPALLQTPSLVVILCAATKMKLAGIESSSYTRQETATVGTTAGPSRMITQFLPNPHSREF